MNHHIDPVKTGLAVGAFLGGLHLAWSLLIAFGVAQALVDFVLWMHMISLPYVVKAFDLSAAATLIVITAIFGYVLGYLYAHLWNRVHRGEM
jgi:hypothetical protein